MLYIRPKSQTQAIRTSIYEQVQGTVEFSTNFCRPSLILGPPGIGKTTALASIADQDYRAIFLSLTHSQKDLKSAMLAVIEACTSYAAVHKGSSIADIHESALNEASNAAHSGKYLIIDEFQRAELPTRMELLGLWEHRQLPVIFCGNPATLTRSRGHVNAAAYDQINSRFGKTVNLKRPIEQDYILFGTHNNVEGTEAYKALVSYGKKTSLREVATLLEISKGLVPATGAITFDILKKAAIHLRGPKEGQKLLIQ